MLIVSMVSNGSSLVFSAWKKSLDSFGTALSQNAIAFVQIDGSLNLRARQGVLDGFCHDANTKVLLMTLATGAVG
jgi:SNF2 family DNA or RNA helicase